jgi:long-chain acyl-CoA synthetase
MKMRFIAVFSKNRVEWTLLDLACVLFGFTLVPIYDTLGPENIPYVLEHTRVETCFCSRQSAEVLLKTPRIGNLKNIVFFDPLPQELQQDLKKLGLVLHSFDDLANNSKPNNHYITVKPDDCLTFCYTSGTTGPPKGAMLSHRNIASFCAVLKYNRDVKINPGDSYLSYLPLAHVLERLAVYAVICMGGTVTSYSGDIQKINLDLALVRPHFFVSVPRLLNRMYDAISHKLNQTTGLQKILVERALKTKLENLELTGSVTHMIYDPLIFHKTK